VGGVVNFLRLAESAGYEAVCLGPAVEIERLMGAIIETDPEIVAVGYRLTPETARDLFAELQQAIAQYGQGHRRWVLGGTDPVVAVARPFGIFEAAFGGTAPLEELIEYLRGGGGAGRRKGEPPQRLMERIEWKAPYPLLRHHFGLPTLDATEEGIARIAESAALDVLSLGTDQNAQEHFFRPAEMDPLQHGAGGVPVRSADDLRRLYAATRRGNFPLMRCYSGTRDQLKWAAMLRETVNNAWGAIPLFWYSQLDGRSQRPLTQSIPEVQAVLRWQGENGIPVEMNESHHWSLRDAPDTVAVAAAFLAAYNAKQAGVANYIQQMMWNNPPGMSPAMDLAKMLAKLELVEALQDGGFRVWRECRAGLTSFPADPYRAKGHLASSTLMQMAVRPHIIHVVAFCEADHAATADDVIESCRIVHGATALALQGLPGMTADPAVARRRSQLVREARLLLDAIASLAEPGVADPFTDAQTLDAAVRIGLLDAPHLMGNAAACGEVTTGFVDGACVAVDRRTRRPLLEEERIAAVWKRAARAQVAAGD
jgi:methylmalonyl-CoA mutase cobalamin-binding subunit